MSKDNPQGVDQLRSEVEQLHSDLEPDWAFKSSQSIYVSDELICSVQLYCVNLHAMRQSTQDVHTCLARREGTSGFSLFFSDLSDGGMDYLLNLYAESESTEFANLIFMDRVKAVEAVYLSGSLQEDIFSQLVSLRGGTGFLCASAGDLTFLRLDGQLPPVSLLAVNKIGSPRVSPVTNGTSIFARNQFTFLFEVDRSPSPGPKSPKAPVFIRPFRAGRALTIKHFPETPMPGSRMLYGSELPGPRGLFVSQESKLVERSQGRLRR